MSTNVPWTVFAIKILPTARMFPVPTRVPVFLGTNKSLLSNAVNSFL